MREEREARSKMVDEESRGVGEIVENAEKLDSLKQIDCKVGETRKQETPSPLRSRNDLTPGTKTKRKARSTRRRLNAMMNNSSLHFSDTDSEGELTLINPHARNPSPGKIGHKIDRQNPIISVTLDAGDDKSSTGNAPHVDNPPWQGLGNVSTGTSRRNSFVENLTDVDEIYTSEPEVDGVCKNGSNKGLVVQDNCYQGETDCEDFSNDEGDEPSPIYVAPRSDILCDFSGGTITTKEGDGPFSIEIRNQMSFDCAGADAKEFTDTPDIVIMPTTDSEDMDASDDEDVPEGACGQREMLEDFDLLAASQIVMKNINKMENSLTVRDVSDNDISDCHTDVEDVD